MPKAKSALVVCPGRGAYTKGDLGYLRRHHSDKADLIGLVDAQRLSGRQTPISALDQSKRFSLAEFGRGDNASPLIFTCSYADYLSLDRQAVDPVAITGNSMGWYTALACAEALCLEDAIHLVNSMGRLVHDKQAGGQALFSLVDEDWQPLPGRRAQLLRRMDEISEQVGGGLHVSIELGGILVVAGASHALDRLLAEGPRGPGRFPIRLESHGAFHSPLMSEVSECAQSILPAARFKAPRIPLIDGRGKVWRPQAAEGAALRRYTFGHQVTRTYDFSAAIRVALRETAPDCIIILGPGDSLGGVIGQILCALGWRGLDSKRAYAALQAESARVLPMDRVGKPNGWQPEALQSAYVLSLGRAEQRNQVVAAAPGRAIEIH